MNVKLNFIPKQIFRWQLISICSLVLISFISSLFYRYSSLSQIQGFGVGFLSVDVEASIVTWYSALLLLLCAILLAVITLRKSRTNSRYIHHWRILALIFIFLSIDETISIHEKLIFPLRSALNTGGIFHFAWIVVYIPLVAIFVIFYLRFLAHLPKTTRQLFWLSGTTYVAGAIGFEMIGGPIAETFGEEALPYLISVHFEEGLELLGLTIFVYGLLDYISFYIENLTVCFKPEKELVVPQPKMNKARQL